MVGGVIGWPHLDHPAPGGEGLGWSISDDHYKYSSLGVTLPRLDANRKANYLQNVSKYNQTQGQLCMIDEVSGESFNLITQ